MFTSSQRETLSKPLIARFCTIGADGYPHVVPVWFMLDGNDVIFISERGTRKVANVQRSSKASMTVGGDDLNKDGYLIVGDCAVEEDPDYATMKRVTYHYEPKEQADKDIEAWSKTDMIVIRMKVNRIVKVF
jgi:PPOX class probable F420-dependent enzyme